MHSEINDGIHELILPPSDAGPWPLPESFVVMEQNSRRTYTEHGCAGGRIQDRHTA